MAFYILKRILLVFPALFGVSIIVFLMMRLIPGDPISIMLGVEYQPEVADQLQRKLGLDQPLIIQYAKWATRLVSGDWGKSIVTGIYVHQEIWQKLPVTLELIGLAMIFAIFVAVPAGIVSATRPNTVEDYGLMTVAMLGISTPEFFSGAILMLIFASKLGWFPAAGYMPPSEGLWQHLWFMVLPAVTLGFPRAAILARLVRASMLEVIRQDYVTTARAKGVAEWWVIVFHAFKNAIIPPLSWMGLQVGYLVGGAIVVEVVFLVPGIASFGIDGIFARDYPRVQGFVLVVTSVFIILNLLVDVVYAYLDPRIRFEAQEQ